ncbi:MAG: dihydrolipoyl dehydrogenase [Deltaproteobacteria bacterium]|nr:MAG: dihydrolipoyl dehydrogenase [Deltaproteobacteria bacterium]
MANTIDTQAVVIGAGPGGYVCAIRLAQLGVRTVLVDKGELGGVCLNVGCIPSKALISASKLVAQIREAEAMGIHVDGVRVDLRQMMTWKDGIVGKLTGGVGTLVKANGGQILRGTAAFADPHALVVTDAEGGETVVRFEHAVIATGSTPAEIPGFAFDGVNVLTSTEALAFDTVPEKLVVIGGGYIGMELGGVWQRLGTEVTVVEYMDQLLPGFESDLVRPVARRFKKAGGNALTGTRAVGWEPRAGGGVQVTVENRKSGKTQVLEADAILSTTGRRPRTAGLNLAAAGLAPDERGFLAVDGAQRTAVDHIFAIGDVAGDPMLAHKASKEGEVAAEVIAGRPGAFDVRAVPAVCFTDPEIASVGLTAKEARDQGLVVKTGKFAFAANGRALSLNDADGFVRLVIDADSEVVLGMEAVGPEVSNLIAEVGLAIELGATASDIGLTIHAHPTLAEAVMEAANAALGHAIHALNR